jgi:hypothetical protein
VTTSGSAQDGVTLKAVANATSDADGGTTTLQWQRLVNGTWTKIAGATNSNYTIGEADEGHKLRVMATFTDDTGQTASASSTPTAVALDSAPQLNTPNSLTVAAGGSVKMNISVSVPDRDDQVSLKISGLTSYELITDGFGTLHAGPVITLTAAQVNSGSGLTLDSSYAGGGQPVNTLTLIASNTNSGEAVSSAAQTIMVTDPPAGSNSVPLLAQFMAANFESVAAGPNSSWSPSAPHQSELMLSLLAH